MNTFNRLMIEEAFASGHLISFVWRDYTYEGRPLLPRGYKDTFSLEYGGERQIHGIPFGEIQRIKKFRGRLFACRIHRLPNGRSLAGYAA